MPKKTRLNADLKKLEFETRIRREDRLIHRNKYLSDRFHDLLHYGTWCFCIYWIVSGVVAFAGKETSALIEVVAKLDVNKHFLGLLTLLFGGGGVGFGLLQRKQSKKKIERLAERIKTLEKQLDPGRTSSGLSSTGEHHKDD